MRTRNIWETSHEEWQHEKLPKSKEEQDKKEKDEFIIRLPVNAAGYIGVALLALILPIYALLIWVGDRVQRFHHKYIHPIDTYVRNERLADEVIALRAQNKNLLQRVGQQGEYR